MKAPDICEIEISRLLQLLLTRPSHRSREITITTIEIKIKMAMAMAAVLKRRTISLSMSTTPRTATPSASASACLSSRAMMKGNNNNNNNMHHQRVILMQRRMNSSSPEAGAEDKEDQGQHGLTAKEGDEIEESIERLEGKPSTVEEEQGSPVSEVFLFCFIVIENKGSVCLSG